MVSSVRTFNSTSIPIRTSPSKKFSIRDFIEDQWQVRWNVVYACCVVDLSRRTEFGSHKSLYTNQQRFPKPTKSYIFQIQRTLATWEISSILFLDMILYLFWLVFCRFRSERLRFGSKLITYLESASKPESTCVCFKYFHELSFSSKNSPLIPLKGRSKMNAVK